MTSGVRRDSSPMCEDAAPVLKALSSNTEGEIAVQSFGVAGEWKNIGDQILVLRYLQHFL